MVLKIVVSSNIYRYILFDKDEFTVAHLLCSGWPVSENDLEKVADYFGVLECGVDFLEEAIREECERWLPNVQDINPDDWTDAYLYVREKFSLEL